MDRDEDFDSSWRAAMARGRFEMDRLYGRVLLMGLGLLYLHWEG